MSHWFKELILGASFVQSVIEILLCLKHIERSIIVIIILIIIRRIKTNMKKNITNIILLIKFPMLRVCSVYFLI